MDSTQLRDDLLSMLVAGHETTGSVLTWTLYLLAQHPVQMAKAQAEVDEVLASGELPGLAQYGALKYVMRCVNESMRLYPHPPVLLRRALVADTLPGGWDVRLRLPAAGRRAARCTPPPLLCCRWPGSLSCNPLPSLKLAVALFFQTHPPSPKPSPETLPNPRSPPRRWPRGRTS